jgi:hypothetical protein
MQPGRGEAMAFFEILGAILTLSIVLAWLERKRENWREKRSPGAEAGRSVDLRKIYLVKGARRYRAG